uniref:Tetraspanin 4a n=1 Tax=Oryzias sinensis TaxID=183150 RepID=A0A8C7ZCB9_9TELE
FKKCFCFSHFYLVSPLSCLQLGGCGILGVGIWLSVTQGNFATLSSSLPSLSAANLLITVGTIIMVIGCLGCVGAVKESRPLLLTDANFFSQNVFRNNLNVQISDLFFSFRCCGVTNHTDWFEVYNASRVPDSCCLEYSDNCGLDNPGTWWTAPRSQMLKLTRCTILFEHLCESVKLMGRKVKRKKEIQNDSQSTASPFLSNDPFSLFVNATSLLCF